MSVTGVILPFVRVNHLGNLIVRGGGTLSGSGVFGDWVFQNVGDREATKLIKMMKCEYVVNVSNRNKFWMK